MKSLTRTLLAVLALLSVPVIAQPPVPAELGSMPMDAQFPKVEFVFEERVTLAPAVVIGDTAVGHRQYIGITGGTVAGPKFNGRVVPGGWDYQSRFGDDCGTMSADYFLQADDGTMVRILNQSANCFSFGGASTERSFFTPRFEAPEGEYGWMTRGTFIATLEGDMGSEDGPAIRIKVYQVK
jgi:hypothetical protein